MANYYGTTRTNYFAVKDAEAFLAEVANYPVSVITDTRGEQTLYGFLDDDPDGSGDVWTTYDGYDESEIEWQDVFARHLADGWVAIFMTAGAEKYRYVSGSATAYNNKGESMHLDLTDIYTLANDLGDNITEASY